MQRQQASRLGCEAAKVAGIDYGALLSRIVKLGLDWEPGRGL